MVSQCNVIIVMFCSCRFGTIMFLTLVLLKIKGVKTGLPEARISLGFLGVVRNLYMEQINTWTIFLRLVYIICFGFAFKESVGASSLMILVFLCHGFVDGS